MGLPASVDTERAVLGAMLLNNAFIAQAESLTPDHFTLDSHRKIYRCMLELWADGVAADFITVGELLRTRRQLDAIGGAGYVASLTEGVPVRTSIDHHIRILHEKKQLRDIIASGNKAVSRAYNQGEKPSDILKDLETSAISIAADTAVRDQDIFLNVTQFMNQYQEQIEWRVDGVIEVGTNGIMVALPKAGKSFVSVGLAVSLAVGVPWLGFPVKRTRTAVVSREDYAGTTARRIRRYIAGNGLSEEDVKQWLWVSSRSEIKNLLLDSPSDLRLLINNLKRHKTEFCILDVLNVLHAKDENDNSEMRQVLKCVDHIRNEVGCQVLVIHHAKKQWEEAMTLSEWARGSTAIGGFAEFLIGVRLVDEESQVRQMKFETKAADPVRPIYWKIQDQPNGGVTLERTEWAPTKGMGQKRAMAV